MRDVQRSRHRVECRASGAPPPSRMLPAVVVAALATAAGLLPQSAAWADAPAVTVAYQPMVSDGLVAGRPFEAWLVLDKPLDPAVPGYEVPAGATIRITFPEPFTPGPGGPLDVVMLHGWPQRAIPVAFTAAQDKEQSRAITIHLDQAIPAGPREKPGLKAIHLRAPQLNPAAPGDYPIAIEFADAGTLTGTTQAIASITPAPVPNIAAYNQLHQGRNQNWQRVGPGEEAPVPLDFLVTLPDAPRASVGLRPAADGGLEIVADDRPIGRISTRGVPVTLTPEPFGPGFARLGIIRTHVRAGSVPGEAEIVASLEGGARYAIRLLVE